MLAQDWDKLFGFTLWSIIKLCAAFYLTPEPFQAFYALWQAFCKALCLGLKNLLFPWFHISDRAVMPHRKATRLN
eukprot:1149644-Pelagomonas_calceolata.AAC.1